MVAEFKVKMFATTPSEKEKKKKNKFFTRD